MIKIDVFKLHNRMTSWYLILSGILSYSLIHSFNALAKNFTQKGRFYKISKDNF